ncbi:hypothetical protein MLD38_019740 [Melastoma candidum]|nr:hypothetical protein MLD38_019740 [Melastoma candidum]
MHCCIWRPGKEGDANAFGVYETRPRNRGIDALDVSVGTFSAHNDIAISISCLKNNSANYTSSMPDLSQIQTLFQAYAPVVYFHPNERYLPSSVNWYFNNGALLYKRGNEANPEAIEPDGANLPQDGSNDGEYWIDLPVDENARERVKKGDLQSAQGYLHVKPMHGGTITDIAIWIFYPFNGPGRAKVQLITVPLGRVGEHIGDWEHLTLRISNFTGELLCAYFSQHSKGAWVDATELQFHKDNKFVAYSSLNGHAMYPKPGLVLQGNRGVGIRNDAGKSNYMLDTGTAFSLVAGDYLGESVTSPTWLNYSRKWGPRISYDSAEDVAKAVKALPARMKSAVENLVKSLPNELFGEDGPTGPKTKRNWGGDEL